MGAVGSTNRSAQIPVGPADNASPATDAQQLADAIAEACRELSDALENGHPLLFVLMVSQVFSACDGRALENHRRIDLAG